MKLTEEWKLILKKAWSIRLSFLAGLFATAEAVLPMFSDSIHRGLFAALSGVAIIGSMVSRVVMQKDFHGDD